MNQIRRDVIVEETEMKRAKKHQRCTDKMENLLNDMDVYISRLEERLWNIEEKLKEFQYIDK